MAENNGKQRARLKPVVKWTNGDNEKLLDYVRANMTSFEVSIFYQTPYDAHLTFLGLYSETNRTCILRKMR